MCTIHIYCCSFIVCTFVSIFVIVTPEEGTATKKEWKEREGVVTGKYVRTCTSEERQKEKKEDEEEQWTKGRERKIYRRWKYNIDKGWRKRQFGRRKERKKAKGQTKENRQRQMHRKEKDLGRQRGKTKERR
jgi:hypothetical protein